MIAWAGQACRRIRRAFARAAGLEDVTPDTLRHTAASWARAGGADLSALAAFLGHGRHAATQLYAKYALDDLRPVAAAIRAKPAAKARPTRRSAS